MSVILPQSSIKPAMWSCDLGMVALNWAQIGLPVPVLSLPGLERCGDKMSDCSGNQHHGIVSGAVWRAGTGEFSFVCKLDGGVLSGYLRPEGPELVLLEQVLSDSMWSFWRCLVSQ